MAEDEGIEWVRGTIRALMVKRRITYAELTRRLAKRGIDENERNLRNKVARGTFGAVFFVQCLEAIGLDTLKLDMTAVMAKPEGEREFASEVPRAPTEKQWAETQRILDDLHALAGISRGEADRREEAYKADPLALVQRVAEEEDE